MGRGVLERGRLSKNFDIEGGILESQGIWQDAVVWIRIIL